MANPDELPARLREIRHRQGMTRPQLAELADVPERAIEAIEQGERTRPPYDVFLSLAAALGVTPDELASPAEKPTPSPARGRPKKIPPKGE